jgi:hypothetical protein
MSHEDRNKALLRRFYEELWTKGNLEMIPELLAEDFVDHHPLPGAKNWPRWSPRGGPLSRTCARLARI